VTTRRLNKSRRGAHWLDRLPVPPALGFLIVLFIVAGGISALNQLRNYRAALAIPTPTLPIVIVQTATPMAIRPTAEPIQVSAVLPRFVVAFDQPVSGAVLGPIPAPAPAAVVARYGADWVMVPWDGAYVWLRAADVGLPPVVDIAPTPQPQVVYVAAPAPAYAAPTRWSIRQRASRRRPPTRLQPRRWSIRLSSRNRARRQRARSWGAWDARRRWATAAATEGAPAFRLLQ
jgi:hypothetical protein